MGGKERGKEGGREGRKEEMEEAEGEVRQAAIRFILQQQTTGN